MLDLLTALGLMCVLEGAMYAAFPRGMREMAHKITAMGDGQIRVIGFVFAIFGFAVIAVLRGL